jgi:fatty-acyl-CoA synthase
VHGTSATPLVGETIGACLDRAASRWADRQGLVVRHQGVRWSYGRLAGEVDAFAAGLLSLGLRPGDRVGIWSPNNAQWVVTQFAAAKTGLVLVTINPAYRPPELEHALTAVGCRALVVAPRFRDTDRLGMLRGLLPEMERQPPGQLHAARAPALRVVVQIGEEKEPGTLRFGDVAARAAPEHRRRLAEIAAGVQFDDPVTIQFTSGTTGAPKAATLTHHAVLNNARFVGETMGLGEGDRLCIPVPLYHCFGMVLGSLACLARGATMVYPSEGFDARAVLEAVEAEACSALHGVPTMFLAELEHPDFRRFRLDSLRTGVIAGAPCPVGLMKRLHSEMHLSAITIAYGMTETGPVSFQTSPDDSLEHRLDTVGRVLPHTEVKIVDGAGRVVPVGAPGELLTRGYCVMRGYWNDPERTREAIDEAGWMHSGDLATLDPDGYCRIVGRIKDMVIRGGENLFPREIEDVLLRHPAVEDAQVFGVPDPKYGEELCAWIRLRPGHESGEEEVRRFCGARLAHFKIPRYVRFVEEFPLTATGKPQKFAMREEMARDLGVSEERP